MSVPQEAIEAIKRGNKVEAIKLTREATSMGLKESKDAVEALIRNDAGLKHAYESKAPKGGYLPGIGALILIAALAYYLIVGRG